MPTEDDAHQPQHPGMQWRMIEVRPTQMLAPHPVVGLVAQQIGFEVEVDTQAKVDRDQYLQRDDLAPTSACRALQSHTHSERSASHSPLAALSTHPLRTAAMWLVCGPPGRGSGMVSPEARAKIAELFANKRAEEVQFPDGKPLDLRRRDWEAEARLDQLP